MDKSLLKKSRIVEELVEIPDVGTVRVRALNRTQAHAVQGVEMSNVEAEKLLLSLALVDPVMTPEEVEEWQNNSSAGEIMPVVNTILRISGMEQNAAKSDVSKI